MPFPTDPGPPGRWKSPRPLRYAWAAAVTIATLGAWITDHCRPPGRTGEWIDAARVLRQLLGEPPGSDRLPPEEQKDAVQGHETRTP